MKENLIYILVFVILALALGLGNFFNGRAETGVIGTSAMTLVTAAVTFAFAEVCSIVMMENKKYNLKNVGFGVLAAVIVSLVCCGIAAL